MTEKKPQIDGEISANEYAHHYRDEKIEMDFYWSIFKDKIYFGITTPAMGWVAVGLEPSGPMKKGADIVVGFIENDTLTVKDSFAYSPTKHETDHNLGGKNNILNGSGSETEKGTTIEFKRKLKTEDNYDKPISEGYHRLLMAYASSDNLSSYHGANRSMIRINFLTGETKTN